MIKREEKWVITFKTTVQAMAMEQVCKQEQAPGRLIPVPKEITAGCGMAWCCALEEADQIKDLMERHDLIFEEQRICYV